MKLLTDTNILVLAAIDPGRLSVAARALLLDQENELSFSAANIWEVAIKHALGRASFRLDPGILYKALIENGYLELPVISAHGIAASTLPRIHKDPFDRLLIAQAAVEGMVLLTSDAILSKYPGPVRLV